MKGGSDCASHAAPVLEGGGKKKIKSKITKKKMAENEFYSVSDKKKMIVDKKLITVESKKTKKGTISYMLRATVGKKKLVKFVSKEVHDKYLKK